MSVYGHRVVDAKEVLYMNVYTVQPMESTAIKRTAYTKRISKFIRNIVTEIL